MSSPPRHYSDREEKLNAITHWAGAAIIAAVGFKYLFHNSGLLQYANIFYFCTLLFMFSASATYHSVKTEKNKVLCRKFDHCAIYFLITGTYAPLMTSLFPDWRGIALMSVLGALTAAGTIIKFCCDSKVFHRIEVGIFLLMGWLCVAVAKPLIYSMDRYGLMLLLSGGIAYTAGVIFYVVKREFFHAVWHLFVFAGAILQFFAVLTLR